MYIGTPFEWPPLQQTNSSGEATRQCKFKQNSWVFPLIRGYPLRCKRCDITTCSTAHAFYFREKIKNRRK